MRLVCPSCGATASAEAWTNDTAIRYTFEALVALPSPVLRQALSYLGLFRQGTKALPWRRALAIARSLRDLVDEGTVHWQGGETRPCPADIWGGAPGGRAGPTARCRRYVVLPATVHCPGAYRGPAPADIWARAMEATLASGPKGLKNHNYLRHVAWELAAETAAAAERARETERQKRRQEEEEPREMPESARAEIEKLKKKWGA
jgi:hypothetical protein